MKNILRHLIVLFALFASALLLQHTLSRPVFAQSSFFHCLGSCPASPVPTRPAVIQRTQQTTISNTVNNRGRQRNNGFIGSFLLLLQELINFLLTLLGGTPQNPITPTPLPVTIIPTMIPMTGMPSLTMPPASSGAISVADIKYYPNNEPLKVFNLTAEVVGDKWTFNGTVPGPEIRVNQGDHVQVNVQNNLPDPTSIHWHGLELPASQDGVPGVTQDAIRAGELYQYNFVATESGTYWYHTHQDTLNQLPKGLFGPLIIVPKQEANQTVRDYTVQYRNTTATESGSTVTLPALPGEKVRVRLINSRAGDFSGAPVKAALIGAPFKVIALDGHDINAPQVLQNQILPIGMSQRFDIEFTMPATGAVQLAEIDKIQTVTFGQGAIAAPADINTFPEFSFVNYGLPTADPRLPRTTYDVNYTLTVGTNLSINGQLYPNVPDLVIKEGQLVHIHIVNTSNMTHPMHLHGHIFSVLKINEQPLTGSPIHLDAILVPPGQTADVAFLADDPGVWMFHCHVLAHAASGLMMMVRYDNVYTPYRTGPGSINVPE